MQKIGLLILFNLSLLLTTAYAQNTIKGKEKIADQFVKIETNLGVMVFQLSALAPKHSANFIRLAKKGYFNNYTFNRVIKNFVIQGGETDSAYAAMDKEGKSYKRIEAEFNSKLYHQKGALAAGRDDNKEKTSFEGQFYVVDGKKYTDAQLANFEKRIGNGFSFTEEAKKMYREVGGTPNLDQNYTVFGKLVKGWDVLEKIASAQKDKADKPLVPIKLQVSVLSNKEIKDLN